MSRAWPFEEVTEATGTGRPIDPAGFVDLYPAQDSDAVVVRIGLNGAQLVLVAPDGFWDKWVYPDVEAAADAARAVGIDRVHLGEYPEDVRVRMNAYRRPKEDFDHGAYQEQGRVGPVIPYPENRFRDREGGDRHPPAARSTKAST